MRAAISRRAPLWAAIVTFVVVAGVLEATWHLRGDDSAGSSGRVASSQLAVQVVQLRRDEALGRVELAVRNRGDVDVVVDRLRLDLAGFTGGGWVPKDSPVPAGQVVNLPTPYGRPRCPAEGEPTLGRVSVRLRIHTAENPTPWSVRLVPSDSRPLLGRILGSLCLQDRLSREVRLGFGPTWRSEGSGDATRLHTTLEARLAPGEAPQQITQLAGTVIYNLEADGGAPPYATLDAAHPTASIPVVLSQARCTGHAKGETKQPYRFLVWLGPPGTDGQAVEFPVTDADRARLRAVCAF